MQSIIIVGVGGFIGAVARYKISTWILNSISCGKFPIGTFAVNIIGCLIIGILATLAQQYEVFNQNLRLMLFTGILGGFTTFSSFGLETIALLQEGEIFTALIYVLASVALGLLAVWVGMEVSRIIVEVKHF